MSKKRKPRMKRKIMKPWSKAMVNTKPSPLWRQELYSSAGSDMKAMLRTTTDYRKVNPIWVEQPGVDPGVRLPYGRVHKSVVRAEWKRFVCYQDDQVQVSIIWKDQEYLAEKEFKLRGYKVYSFHFSSLDEAKKAVMRGIKHWRRTDAP